MCDVVPCTLINQGIADDFIDVFAEYPLLSDYLSLHPPQDLFVNTTGPPVVLPLATAEVIAV